MSTWLLHESRRIQYLLTHISISSPGWHPHQSNVVCQKVFKWCWILSFELVTILFSLNLIILVLYSFLFEKAVSNKITKHVLCNEKLDKWGRWRDRNHNGLLESRILSFADDFSLPWSNILDWWVSSSSSLTCKLTSQLLNRSFSFLPRTSFKHLWNKTPMLKAELTSALRVKLECCGYHFEECHLPNMYHRPGQSAREHAEGNNAALAPREGPDGT